MLTDGGNSKQARSETAACHSNIYCVDFQSFINLRKALITTAVCHSSPIGHGRRKRGVWRGSDIPNYLCGGDIDMYIPPRKT